MRLSIKGVDRVGLLNEISRYISLVMGVNMRKVYLSTDEGIFSGYIDLYVHDKAAMERMIRRLNSIDGIKVWSEPRSEPDFLNIHDPR